MAENTRQLRCIVMLYDNLAAQYAARADVFVGGNQNWYPVEGHPEGVTAPDVYVVFGRPKGGRPSWKQWAEAGVPLTVVFEVLSPSNTRREMADKYAFYEEHGVEEYYHLRPGEKPPARLPAQTRRVRPCAKGAGLRQSAAGHPL